jgi:hypothetical protein
VSHQHLAQATLSYCCVSQLSIIGKLFEIVSFKEKGLFWLTVLEVSVIPWLVDSRLAVGQRKVLISWL